ncbi:MAG: ribonuclease Z [Sphaerochaetaceae bacterium]|jgi:ribonuclease Z|nr:ribonuclease Z [Sphaerochaetaceae bacterium]
MNLDVFVLGTSGMMPLPGRFLTSALVRRDGELFLFDCGEGTQISLKMLNIKWKKISAIFISHMHADPVTGLPGMLMLSSQVDRSEPLYIYGPAKLKDYVEQTRKLLDMYINYEIVVRTIDEGIVHMGDGFRVEAFPLRHTKPCFGYTLREDKRPGQFHPEQAANLKVPKGPLWAILQNGGEVTNTDGTVVHPEQVLGPQREGRTFSYVTDTLWFPKIASYVAQSDILLCEGMFEHALLDSAAEKKHMTSSQAAQVAKDAQVKQMGLIHYSPRYTDRELKQLLVEAKEIFPDTFLTKDRMEINLPLID